MTTVLQNVRPLGSDAVDVRIEDGLIAEIAAGIDLTDGAEVIDGENALLFPGLIDAHTHMDKTLIGLPWHPTRPSRDIFEITANERELRRREGIDSYQQSMRHAHAAIAAGTTHIRSFADIDTEWGLKGMHGLMQTRDEIADRLTIQTVAFPQSGMLIREGTVDLLDQALADGADVIGGLDPSSVDRDPVVHLDTIFRLAEKHDVDVDMHLHEPGEIGAFAVDLICDRTETLGWQGRVTISHAFCLGDVGPARLDGLIQRLADNRIAIATTAPANRAVPPIFRLREAGIPVMAGNDGIQDSWGPLNRPEMLLRAYLIALKFNCRLDDQIHEVIDVVTYGAAPVLGLDDYGFAEGKAADICLVPGENHAWSIVYQPTPSLVMKRGRVTARHGEVV